MVDYFKHRLSVVSRQSDAVTYKVVLLSHVQKMTFFTYKQLYIYIHFYVLFKSHMCTKHRIFPAVAHAHNILLEGQKNPAP